MQQTLKTGKNNTNCYKCRRKCYLKQQRSPLHTALSVLPGPLTHTHTHTHRLVSLCLSTLPSCSLLAPAMQYHPVTPDTHLMTQKTPDTHPQLITSARDAGLRGRCVFAHILVTTGTAVGHSGSSPSTGDGLPAETCRCVCSASCGLSRDFPKQGSLGMCFGAALAHEGNKLACFSCL